MKFYQYILLFLSCLLLHFGTITDSYACGPMADPYENRVTFFNPDIFQDSLYRLTYWDAARYKKQTDWDATLAERHRYNVEDWQRYFKGVPSVEDIASVVYEANSVLLKRLYDQIAYGKPYNIQAAEWKDNELLKYLYKTKDIDAINYLVVAKQCEPFVTYDPWENSEKNPDEVEKLIQTVLVKLENCRTEFIKLRYAYQAVRLALYTGRNQQAIDIYTRKAAGIIGRNSEDQALITQSVIRYWLMALRAGAHKRLGDHPPALYGFSRVFLESRDKKELAIQNFEYTGEQDWQQALAIASRMPGSASVLWMLRGLKNDQLDLEILQKMYQDLSSSEFLEAMMVREINKVEEQLLSPAMTKAVAVGGENADTEKAQLSVDGSPFNASIWESIQNFFKGIWNTIRGWFGSDNVEDGGDEMNPLKPQVENAAYVQQFKTFVDTSRMNGNVNNPSLWGTASAYLAYLLQDYDEAIATLEEVGRMGATLKVKQQAILTHSLAILAKEGKMNAGLENNFYEALKDLPKPEQAYENFNVYSRTMMHLAQHYLLQGNTAKAFLCFNSAKSEEAARLLVDFHTSQADLKELRTLASKSDKTPFEAHLFEDSLLTEDLILDISATKLMREHHFEAALKQYQQISPEYWQQSEKEETWFGLQYNNILCSFDQNPLSQEPITERCNKMEFAQKVVDLLHAAKETPVESYYKLGNGFVNTPFWGYAGNLWEGGLIWTMRGFQNPVFGEYGIGTYPFNLPSITDTLQGSINHFADQYGTRKTAMNYYKKVLEYAKDNNRELGAKAAYLAKYCQENPQASIHEGNDDDPTYAKILVSEYGDTQFFQEIIQECPDLKAYQ